MTPKEKVIEGLMEMKLIWPGFQGQIVLHIGEGPSICDAERHEDSLLRRTKEKKYLDTGLKVV
jgi:hypothetical protein